MIVSRTMTIRITNRIININNEAPNMDKAQQYQFVLAFQPYFIWRWFLTLQYCLEYQKFHVIDHENKNYRRLRTSVLSSAASYLDSPYNTTTTSELGTAIQIPMFIYKNQCSIALSFLPFN